MNKISPLCQMNLEILIHCAFSRKFSLCTSIRVELVRSLHPDVSIIFHVFMDMVYHLDYNCMNVKTNVIMIILLHLELALLNESHFHSKCSKIFLLLMHMFPWVFLQPPASLFVIAFLQMFIFYFEQRL